MKHAWLWILVAGSGVVPGTLVACAQPMHDDASNEFAPARGADRAPVVPGGALCGPCEVDGDCGVKNAKCLTDTVTSAGYCTTPCSTDEGCPEGYSCAPVHGSVSMQCVPAYGSCESEGEPADPGGEPGPFPGEPDPGEPDPGEPDPGGEPNPGGTGGTAGAGGSGGTGGNPPEPGGSGGSSEPTPGGGLPTPPDGVDVLCYGVCFSGLYTACTCYVSDPCGWSNDGTCDATCATLFPGAHFDDTGDCADGGGGGCGIGGTGGTGPDDGCGAGGCEVAGSGGAETGEAPCGGSCEAGYYDACTCSGVDPCGWSADGYCDSTCDSLGLADVFDDAPDCG